MVSSCSRKTGQASSMNLPECPESFQPQEVNSASVLLEDSMPVLSWPPLLEDNTGRPGITTYWQRKALTRLGSSPPPHPTPCLRDTAIVSAEAVWALPSSLGQHSGCSTCFLKLPPGTLEE